MLMARSSHRLLCSTNNELLCGASFAKMPLFESTGVGRRQRSLKGMVLSRPRNRTARWVREFRRQRLLRGRCRFRNDLQWGDGSLHGELRHSGSDVLGLGFGNFEWLASFNQGKTPRLDVGLRRHKITWLPRRINGSRIGGRSTPLAAQIPERIEREQHAKKILFPCLFVFPIRDRTMNRYNPPQ